LDCVAAFPSPVARGYVPPPVGVRCQKVPDCGLGPFIEHLAHLMGAELDSHGSVVVALARGKRVAADPCRQPAARRIALVVRMPGLSPFHNALAQGVLAADLLECAATALLDELVLRAARLPLLPGDGRQGCVNRLATGMAGEPALPQAQIEGVPPEGKGAYGPFVAVVLGCPGPAPAWTYGPIGCGLDPHAITVRRTRLAGHCDPRQFQRACVVISWHGQLPPDRVSSRQGDPEAGG
jgi:hypothetical protein